LIVDCVVPVSANNPLVYKLVVVLGSEEDLRGNTVKLLTGEYV